MTESDQNPGGASRYPAPAHGGSPGGVPYLFTEERMGPASDAVAAVRDSPTWYLGPEDNVTIVPVLAGDPEPVIPGGAGPAPLDPRPYARIIAPRKASQEMTLELVAAKRAPRPMLELLSDEGVRMPAGWHARHTHRFGSRRRVAEIRVPRGASPTVIVEFACSALEVLAPAATTGRWLAVRSAQKRFPGSVSG